MKSAALILASLSCLPAAAWAAPTAAPVDVTQLKQERTEAVAENQLITELAAAQAAKDLPKAEAISQKLVAMDPARWEYRKALGDTEFTKGKYTDALQAYGAGLLSAERAKMDAHVRQAMAAMYSSQGNAYLKLKRNDEAVKAFTQAAAVSDKPATAWFNLCAVEYNMGVMDAALAACNKALTADPKKADAWFIKGSILVGNSSVDAAGKMVAPPGAVEALKKYQALAPDGPHADDAKQMLDFIQPPR
jgi:tetratricopeptide (TPR) repeat protein